MPAFYHQYFSVVEIVNFKFEKGQKGEEWSPHTAEIEINSINTS